MKTKTKERERRGGGEGEVGGGKRWIDKNTTHTL